MSPEPEESEIPDDTADLVAASASSTGFWDNPTDDEEWNAAEPTTPDNGDNR
jgi:hypothetical protein